MYFLWIWQWVLQVTWAEPTSTVQLGCQLIDNTLRVGNTRHPSTFFKTSAPIVKVIFLIPSIKSILKTPPTPHSPRAVNTSGWFCFLVLVVSFPAAIYLFKVNNGLTRIMCNMCIYSKLPIKAPGTIQNKI